MAVDHKGHGGGLTAAAEFRTDGQGAAVMATGGVREGVRSHRGCSTSWVQTPTLKADVRPWSKACWRCPGDLRCRVTPRRCQERRTARTLPRPTGRQTTAAPTGPTRSLCSGCPPAASSSTDETGTAEVQGMPWLSEPVALRGHGSAQPGRSTGRGRAGVGAGRGADIVEGRLLAAPAGVPSCDGVGCAAAGGAHGRGSGSGAAETRRDRAGVDEGRRAGQYLA